VHGAEAANLAQHLDRVNNPERLYILRISREDFKAANAKSA
jgi:hypothetical protein